jgi:putative ABC transport system permease protein
MGVIWKIAFRNLREHKTKTLIIGVIITIGITVLVVGNSLMDTATAGIKRSYIDNYTGHIIISGQHPGGLSLFGSNSMDDTIPVLPEYEKVRAHIAALPEVEAISPQAYGQATISLNDEVRGFVMMFGIDPESYRNMFPSNIEMIQGEFLKPGEEGIMLSERTAKRLIDEDEKPVAPGDKLLLTGISMSSGTRIREVTIRGIFRFKESNPQLDMISLIDITNLRALTGLNVQSQAEIVLDEQEKALLGEIDEQSFFGGEDSLFGSLITDHTASSTQWYSEESLFDILGESTSQETIDMRSDAGTWHFLLIKLKNPARTEQVRRQLQQWFDSEGIPATTQSWLEGAGVMASMTSGLKTVFNIIVLIVAVVAVIIIMNTLVISVTERIAEIGTMRAIGAQKRFIRQMVTFETVIISGIFGLAGIVLGGLILLALNLTGIRAPNVFFRVLFGGEVLHPVLSLQSVFASLVVVTVIAVVASLYPVSIALKIQPVKAMQSS